MKNQMFVTKEYRAIMEDESLSSEERAEKMAKYMLDSPHEVLGIYHIYYEEHPERKDLLPLLDFLTARTCEYWSVRTANKLRFQQATLTEQANWNYEKNPILIDTLNSN